MENVMEIPLDLAGDDEVEATQFALIGKIVVDRQLNRRGIMNVLRAIWSPRVLHGVTEVSQNLYGFYFVDRKSMEMALNQGPWLVMGHCLMLKRWAATQSVQEIVFDEIFFWIQAHNLPLNLQIKSNTIRIGRTIGRLIDVEDPEWNRGVGRGFLRFKVAMDFKKPLVNGFWTSRADLTKVWVDLKYERLGDFCYNCGMLGHTDRGCEKDFKILSYNVREGRYGPGMRTGLVRDWTIRELSNDELGDGGVPELAIDQDQSVEKQQTSSNRLEEVVNQGSNMRNNGIGDKEQTRIYVGESSRHGKNVVTVDRVGFENSAEGLGNDNVGGNSVTNSEGGVDSLEVEIEAEQVGKEKLPVRKPLLPVYVNTLNIQTEHIPNTNTEGLQTTPIHTKTTHTHTIHTTPILDKENSCPEPDISYTVNTHFPCKTVEPNNPIIISNTEHNNNTYRVETEDGEYTVEQVSESGDDVEQTNGGVGSQLVPFFRNMSIKRNLEQRDKVEISNTRNKARLVGREGMIQKVFKESEEVVMFETETNEQVIGDKEKELVKVGRKVRRSRVSQKRGSGVSRSTRQIKIEKERLWEVPVMAVEAWERITVVEHIESARSRVGLSGCPSTATEPI
ncbi:hypothetical protein CCACVL1_14522 [Corchorus capsularis]|uniref:CCHC-type domain-containing protein n=1 Tax=Corchorus capsularis TaxID=210143 RepID=A0A1R3I6U1_COCAP|nr:hypothetical protein CCACVL1_14522 [Corchorus capsularis]